MRARKTFLVLWAVTLVVCYAVMLRA